MASALHDQAQLVFPGKVDGRDDVFGLARDDRIDAGLGCPAVDPARRLRQAGMITDVKGVSERLKDFAGCGTLGITGCGNSIGGICGGLNP